MQDSQYLHHIGNGRAYENVINTEALAELKKTELLQICNSWDLDCNASGTKAQIIQNIVDNEEKFKHPFGG